MHANRFIYLYRLSKCHHHCTKMLMLDTVGVTECSGNNDGTKWKLHSMLKRANALNEKLGWREKKNKSRTGGHKIYAYYETVIDSKAQMLHKTAEKKIDFIRVQTKNFHRIGNTNNCDTMSYKHTLRCAHFISIPFYALRYLVFHSQQAHTHTLTLIHHTHTLMEGINGRHWRFTMWFFWLLP